LENERVVLKDTLDQWFGDRDRKGELINDGRTEAVDVASISGPIEKEEAIMSTATLRKSGHISKATERRTHLRASLSFPAYNSVTVCEIADFPVPAGPLSQQI
jgi:hypothetical protein